MLDIHDETKLMGSKLVDTPMNPNVRLCVDQKELMTNPDSYRRSVEKLNYLTITRPYISFAVSVVSQFMSAHRTSHWVVAPSIIKYLKAHLGRGLFYRHMVI